MATFSYCGPSGGLGGNKFNDGQTGNRKITEVRISSGWYIDSIQLVYNIAGSPKVNPKHGGSGGKLKSFKLGVDEQITEIGGKHTKYVNTLWIKTNKGRTEKWGGTKEWSDNRDFIYSVPPGTRIDGFWGRSGWYIDAIGVIILTP